MATNLDLNAINYQDQLRSKPIRENYTDIQTEFNSLNNAFTTSVASTASEVTTARDNFTTLQTNINARRVNGAGLYTGGLIYAQTVPDDTVRVTAGKGLVYDGRGVNFLAGTSGTVGSIVSPRWIVAAANADNTVSLELGATGAHPVLPDLTNSMLGLATIYQNTSGTIALSDIQDAKNQGARTEGRYYFKIQDAINSLSSTLGGVVKVGPGRYIEEVDLSGKNNVHLDLDSNAVLKRQDNVSFAITSVNTASSITTGNKITGGQLQGNGKTGNKQLLRFAYTNRFSIKNTILDGNASATGGNENYLIGTCNEFTLDSVFSYSGATTTLNRGTIKNCLRFTSQSDTDFMEENFSLFDRQLIFNRTGAF